MTVESGWSLRSFLFPFFLLCSVFLLVPTELQAATTLELEVNEQRTLDIGAYRNIYAVDRDVVSIHELPGQRQVIVSGVGEGTTSMTILFADGRTQTRKIRVVSRAIDEEALARLIGDIYGVELVSVGGTVAVRGEIRTQSDWKRYRTVVDRFTNVIDLVEDLTTRANVQLDVKVFEVTRSGVKELGIEWFQSIQQFNLDFQDEARGLQYDMSTSPGGIRIAEETLPALDAPLALGRFGRMTPLIMELRALEEAGMARLLAKPQLVSENGGKAHFQVGGKLPYPVENYQGVTTVEFQDYGTILEMEPRIISADHLSLKLLAEVSEPDFANSVMGTPGIKARRAETQVQLKVGETIAIAGLISTGESVIRRSLPIPILGSLPLIGSLLGSEKTQVDEIETLILVTPRILSDESLIGAESIDSARADLDAWANRGVDTDESEPSNAPEGW